MRKSNINYTRAFLAVFLCITMVLTLFLDENALAYITGSGQIRIISQNEKGIGKGVVLNSWQAQNIDGKIRI